MVAPSMGSMGRLAAVALCLALGLAALTLNPGCSGDDPKGSQNGTDGGGLDGVDVGFGLDGGPDGGHDGGGGHQPPGQAVLPGQWCLEHSRATCSILERCPLPHSPANGDDCIARLTAQCWNGDHLEEAIDNGAVSFDGEAADQCLQMLQNASCDLFYQSAQNVDPGPLAVCSGAVSGLSGDGEPCPLGIECDPGNWCSYMDGCPGVCTAKATIGQTCDAQHLCDPQGAICSEGTCQPLPQESGDPCLNGYCHYPLECSSSSQTCAPLSLAGGNCGTGGPYCFHGLVCWTAQGESDGQCVPLRGDGETCFSDAQCGIDSNGHHPLVCLGGVCGVAPGEGEPCHGFMCSDAWCDTQAIPPTCKAFPSLDEPCVQGSLCAPDQACLDGVCRHPKEAGEPCTSPNQCRAGRCPAGKCVEAHQPPCQP